MNPNSIKNLTYAAVALCIVALVYLVYKSVKNATQKDGEAFTSSEPISNNSEDSLYNIVDDESVNKPSSGSDKNNNQGIATIHDNEDDLNKESTNGDIVTPKKEETPSSYNTRTTPAKTTAPVSKGLKEVTVDDNARTVAPAKKTIPATKPPTTPDKEPVAKATTKSEKAPVGKTAKPATASSGKFVVVAGSFQSQSNANAMLAKVKKQGFSGAIVNTGTVHAVQIGKYNSRADADAMIKKLKAKGIDAIVKIK